MSIAVSERPRRRPRGDTSGRVVEHPSLADRAAREKARRAEVGRRVHGEWQSLPARRDPVDQLEPVLGQSAFSSHGQRVVEGQRLMQSASDIMLGWIRVAALDGVKRDFYVRQLWDAKGSALVELMSPRVMTMYAGLCGWTLARARALGRPGGDRQLPRVRRRVRPGACGVCRDLRRQERTRLCRAGRCRGVGGASPQSEACECPHANH
jgi:hypothetical protein